MPRYYFHVVTPTETVEDQEGTELPSLEAARKEAIKDARQLMGSAMQEGRDISGRRIEIVGGGGEILLVVPFADAFTVER